MNSTEFINETKDIAAFFDDELYKKYSKLFIILKL